MVRLEVRTDAGKMTTTELVTFSRPGVVSTLAGIGLMLAETKTLLAKLLFSADTGSRRDAHIQCIAALTSVETHI